MLMLRKGHHHFFDVSGKHGIVSIFAGEADGPRSEVAPSSGISTHCSFCFALFGGGECVPGQYGPPLPTRRSVLESRSTLRNGAILSPRVAGAITGMLAGLVSTTVLEVHCPNLDVWHILVWHLGIALLGMVVGLFVATVGEAIRDRMS
jgi:hypothetical protein